MQKRACGLVLLIILCAFVSSLQAMLTNIPDNKITIAVQTELLLDEMVQSNFIDVNTGNGIVTLDGTVDTILGKERAENIAEMVIGVRSVVNLIDVKPRYSYTDSELHKAVNNALLSDPATDSYEINVEADDGMITLTGTVDSWQEKQLAETVAKGVKGVKGVVNNIGIDYKTVRPDSEIKQDIKARLANDILVDDYLINVEVNDGKVILTGTVGSLGEKKRTYSDAWVAGVKSVDTKGLNIEWWARDKMRRENKYKFVSTEEVKNPPASWGAFWWSVIDA